MSELGSKMKAFFKLVFYVAICLLVIPLIIHFAPSDDADDILIENESYPISDNGNEVDIAEDYSLSGEEAYRLLIFNTHKLIMKCKNGLDYSIELNYLKHELKKPYMLNILEKLELYLNHKIRSFFSIIKVKKEPEKLNEMLAELANYVFSSSVMKEYLEQ